MTEAQAIELISQRFVTAWPSASSSTPFALDNEALPSSGTFAQLTIQHTGSRQITMGPAGYRRWERRGVIYIRLWSPKDAGRAAIAALCDAARVTLEGQDLGTIGDTVTTEAGATREVGPDGRWYMVAVQFDFTFYETR